jgi:hypothetical protein
MADDQRPGVRISPLQTILAGLAGTLAVFSAALVLGKLVVSRRAPAPPEGTAGATPPPR